MNTVELADVAFSWTPGPPLLRIAALTLAPGESLFISGPSGSGKSTLLGLIGGVLTASSGQVRILGQDLGQRSAAGRDRLRADHIGFIFQMFNLLPYLSVLDNVALSCRFSARRRSRATANGGDVSTEAQRLLGRLGLTDPALLARPVTALSIGQQQRVAAARALIGQPDLVIADEPTSALDADARRNFLDLLIGECQSAGSAIIFVSHDQALAPRFNQRISLAELNTAARPETA